MGSGVMRWLLLAALVGLAPAALADRAARLGQPPGVLAVDDPNQARVIVKYRSASALARSAGGVRAQHADQVGRRLGLPLLDGRPLGPHTQGLRGQGLFGIGINFDDGQPAIETGGELFQHWRQRPTGRTPRGPEIHQHRLIVGPQQHRTVKIRSPGVAHKRTVHDTFSLARR